MQLKVKKLDSQAILPKYAKAGDAGLDLVVLETAVIAPHNRFLVRTGIAVEVPIGHVGLVWDRSGNALKKGLTILGGVIDCGYRGEIFVITLNTTTEPVEVKAGERIGQLLVQAFESVDVIEVTDLGDSERGTTGLGSTGH